MTENKATYNNYVESSELSIQVNCVLIGEKQKRVKSSENNASKEASQTERAVTGLVEHV